MTWCARLGALAHGLAASAPISRRRALGSVAALAAVAAGCAPAVSPAQRETARALADTSPSVDLHSHPGMFRASPLGVDAQAEHNGAGRGQGIPDYAGWPSIPEGLLARGFSQADVAKVMGGNFLRVFGEVAGA